MFCLLVLRFYGPVNLIKSCRARSVYLITLLQGRLSPLSVWPILAHILSPEADICLSWISGKGENDRRKYFMINLHERMLPIRRGSNSEPPDQRINMVQIVFLSLVKQFWDKLTHLSLSSHKRNIGTECGVWSGSTLFALNIAFSIKRGNNNRVATHF